MIRIAPSIRSTLNARVFKARVLRAPVLRALALFVLPTAVCGFFTAAEAHARPPVEVSGFRQQVSDTTPSPGTPATSESIEDQEPEPLTQEQAATDEEIRSRLQALYDRIGSLRGVSVDVEAGIVRLRGRALSLEARQRAVQLAEDAEGVVFVEDDLRVVTDLGQRLEPAVDRLREYALGAVAFLPLLLVAVLILVISTLLGGWVARLDGPHLRFAKTAFTRGLVRQLIRLTFTVAGLLVALELLDATALVGAVLGAAGVFGLAVGFAFKDIVENHLAGIMLSVRQPFAPNDHIMVGSQEGKVVRLTARETILMTLAGNHVRIPNAELYRNVMTNYTRNPRRRFEFAVSVGTGDDLLAAQETGLEALADMKGVMDDPPPSARVTELGDSWVTVHFFGWVDQHEADFGRVRSEAIRLVKLALEKAEISMPSPEYAVILRGEGGGTRDKGVHHLGGPEETEGGPAGEARGAAASEVLQAPDAPEPTPEQQDVSVDRTLDEQIAEDRRISDEGDLLTESRTDEAVGDPEGASA